MGTCKITKLNSAIDNGNIPYLNSFKIEVSALGATENERKITFGFNGSYKVIPVGSSCTVNGQSVSTSYEGSNSCTIIVANADYHIWVIGKDHLMNISHPSYFDSNVPTKFPISLDVSQFDYSSITTLYTYNLKLYGKLSNKNISIMNITNGDNATVLAAKSDFEFDISGMPLTSLKAQLCQKATGNLAALSAIYTSYGLSVYKTSIGGEVNEFAAAQVALGKTSGTISLSPILSNMTDDGNEITVAYIKSKGGTGGYNINIEFSSSYPSGYKKTYV